MKRFQPGLAIRDAREIFYVDREADGLLFERLARGDLTLIIAPRQVGKTSLLKRTSERLVAERGAKVVFLDLQARGVAAGTTQEVAQSRWYRSLADVVARTFGLGSDVKDFFDSRADRTIVATWVDFLRHVVLAHTSSSIVLMVDEIDRTRTLPFPAADFFGALQSVQNARAFDAAWRRFTVCLCGVTAPGDLVSDAASQLLVPDGGVIRLEDFTREQISALGDGLTGLGGDPGRFLDVIHAWTRGHPAMTQKLCGALVAAPDRTGGEGDRVDRLVHELFLGEGRQHEALLVDVEHRFPLGSTSEEATLALSTYQGVRCAQGPIPFRPDDPSHLRLVLSGLVAERRGLLEVRSPIYAQAFDDAWVASRLEHRVVAQAVQRWLHGGRLAEDLLVGDELARSQGWARGRPLADFEQEFMAASAIHQAQLETRKAQVERARARRVAVLFTMVSVLFAVLLFVAVTAVRASQRASNAEAQRAREAQDHLAESRKSAAKDYATNAILSGRDDRLERETVAGALRAAHQSNGLLAELEFAPAAIAALVAAPRVGRLHGHRDAVLGFAWRRDGSAIVTASRDRTARVWNLTGDVVAQKLEGHLGEVRAANFSPDGLRVVTASADRTARIWDAITGAQIFVLSHDDQLANARFSPDGRRVVTASADGTASVWDARTGRLVSQLTGHDAGVSDASFSPDGNRIVTASDDRKARLWDATSGTVIAVLAGHSDVVHDATFSPDGNRIVTASADRSARLWDGTTGRPLQVLHGHTDDVTSAAFSPDGSRVLTASFDRTARLWDGESGKTLHTLQLHTDVLRGAAFSPDGGRVVTASDDRTASVWDAATGQLLQTIHGHTGWVRAASFAPDGQSVVTISEDSTVGIWDLDMTRPVQVLQGHSDAVRSTAFSSDGSRIVTASDDGTARVWDAATGRPLELLLGHTRLVWSAAFSPDNARIVTASADKTARIWDAATGAIVRTLEGHTATVWSAAFSPDGASVVTASEDHTARIWDAATGRPLRILRGHAGGVVKASFSPDGTRVVTASSDKKALVFRAADGALLRALEGHGDGLRSATFSPDGTRILTASLDNTAGIWDATTGERLQTLPHSDDVWNAVFSRDGDRVVTASNDGTAGVWDAKTGRLETLLDAQAESYAAHQTGPCSTCPESILSASFSPDGARVVTASGDTTARIWDVASGGLLQTLQGHSRMVYAAVFSPDGGRVLTASGDGTARLWPIDYRAILTDVCAYVRGEIRFIGPDYKDMADICSDPSSF